MGVLVKNVSFSNILRDKANCILVKGTGPITTATRSARPLLSSITHEPLCSVAAAAESVGSEELVLWEGTFWRTQTHPRRARGLDHFAPLPRPPTQGRTTQRPLLVSQFRPTPTTRTPLFSFLFLHFFSLLLSVPVLLCFLGPDGRCLRLMMSSVSSFLSGQFFLWRENQASSFFVFLF